MAVASLWNEEENLASRSVLVTRFDIWNMATEGDAGGVAVAETETGEG